MADGFSVEIKETPKGSIGLFAEGKLAKQVVRTVEAVIDSIGAHAAERAQANAPIKDGDLRRSIRHKVTTRGAVVETKIIAGVSYSLRMHEELTTAGPLQLGFISRGQPSTAEGGVGGKFIERVVLFHTKNYQKFLGDSLKTNLPKAVLGKISVKKITDGTS